MAPDRTQIAPGDRIAFTENRAQTMLGAGPRLGVLHALASQERRFRPEPTMSADLLGNTHRHDPPHSDHIAKTPLRRTGRKAHRDLIVGRWRYRPRGVLLKRMNWPRSSRPVMRNLMEATGEDREPCQFVTGRRWFFVGQIDNPQSDPRLFNARIPHADACPLAQQAKYWATLA